MLPHIDILSIIISNLDNKNILKFSLCCSDIYNILREKIDQILAVQKISNWWINYMTPIDVSVYNHYEACEYLINITYKDAGCYIPNMVDPLNVMIMIRTFRGKKYLQFNRTNNQLEYWNGFIIGKTDKYGNFFDLHRNEFLLCLKRYEQCVDPRTRLIWRKVSDEPRKIIGKIDKYYNIYFV